MESNLTVKDKLYNHKFLKGVVGYIDITKCYFRAELVVRLFKEGHFILIKMSIYHRDTES